MFKFSVRVLFGGLIAYGGFYLITGLASGLFGGLGFALAFALPAVVLVLVLAAMPAAVVIFRSLTSPERAPYGIGVIVAVAAHLLLAEASRIELSNSIPPAIAERRLLPLNEAPTEILIDCVRCNTVGIPNLLARSNARILFRNREQTGQEAGKTYELLRLPTEQCDVGSRQVWDEYLLQRGYVDWCIDKREAAEPDTGLVFRFGWPAANSILGEDRFKSRSGLPMLLAYAAEFQSGNERPIGFWQGGTQHIDAGLFSRNVEVGPYFLHRDFLAQTLSIPDFDRPIDNPNRNHRAEVALAFRFTSHGDSHSIYLAMILLSSALRRHDEANRAEIRSSIEQHLKGETNPAAIEMLTGVLKYN